MIKMKKWMMVLIFSLLLITLFPLSKVAADTYVSPWITLTSTQMGNPGSSLQVAGYSYTPGAEVAISLGPSGSELQQVISGTVGTNGSFKLFTKVPSDSKAGDKLTLKVIETQNGANLNTTSLDFLVGRVSVYAKTKTVKNSSNSSSYGTYYYTNRSHDYYIPWYYTYGFESFFPEHGGLGQLQRFGSNPGDLP